MSHSDREEASEPDGAHQSSCVDEEQLNCSNEIEETIDDSKIATESGSPNPETPPKAGNPEKQEAKKVCKNISRLLRDRQAKTRGSRMFQKRRRRSERFAIVGYGTRPAEEQEEDLYNTASGSEGEDSDSIFLISTDDEIAVYDRPGPNNVLERDRNLSFEEQIIQNQHRHLAEDATKMKGKGAKLFAKRQQRMEKFVVEGKSTEEQETTNGGQSAGPVAFVNHAYNPREQSRESSTPVTLNNIHSTSGVGGYPDANGAGQGINELTAPKEAVVPTPGLRKFRPADKQPWADDSQVARYASADWSSDEDAPCQVRPSYESDYAGGKPLRRNAFKSVKAPNDTLNMPFLRPEPTEPPTGLYQPAPCDGNLYQKPAKRWTSVKFDPKAKNKPKETENKGPVAPYPFASSKPTAPTQPFSSVVPNQSLPLAPTTWKPPTREQVAQLTKNVVTSSNQQRQTYDARAPSPSVALLQEPLRHRSPSPFQRVPLSRDPSPGFGSAPPEEDNTRSRIPASPVPQSAPVKFQPQFNGPARPAASKPPQQQQEGDKKPKVAACMKLLDPSKGSYQPKMEIVYKSSPSLGAILDEERNQNIKDRPPSRNSHTPQFNKPISTSSAAPQVSYLQNNSFGGGRKNVPLQGKPQALGSIAGEMKGKGAKMFEKQQQRMDRYTKECNGSKEAKIALPQVQHNGSNRQVAPDRANRKRMNDVMGEFRKMSDSESPRRPSANRKGKSKDPFHYQQYYIVRRPPSAADFVNADDAASDTNSATSSLTSSYDRGSTSSSGRPMEQPIHDDVFKSGGNEVAAPKGPPPRVAPKPDLARFLSSESNNENSSVSIAVDNDTQLAQDAQQLTIERPPAEPNHADHQQNQPAYQNQPSIDQKPSPPTPKQPSYAVWSPNQGVVPPADLTSHLPPPPSYNEVTSQKMTSPKPLFRASVPYSVYNPTATSGGDLNQGGDASVGFVQPPPVRRISTLAPRPKFVSKAVPKKWSPGGN